MKTRLFAALLVLCAATLAAQAPATPNAAHAALVPTMPAHEFHSDLGYVYIFPPYWEYLVIPKDWKNMIPQPMLPAAVQQVANYYGSEAIKLGACVKLPLTAYHGNPPSAMNAVVEMSFDCIGHTFSAQELPSIASGVSKGLKRSMEIVNPVSNTYTLGTHSMWIERASGSLVGHPEIKQTVETVCSVLKKGVVCCMVLTSDDDALQTFEQGTVTLDDDAATALVPADALQKKP